MRFLVSGFEYFNHISGTSSHLLLHQFVSILFHAFPFSYCIAAVLLAIYFLPKPKPVKPYFFLSSLSSIQFDIKMWCYVLVLKKHYAGKWCKWNITCLHIWFKLHTFFDYCMGASCFLASSIFLGMFTLHMALCWKYICCFAMYAVLILKYAVGFWKWNWFLVF